MTPYYQDDAVTIYHGDSFDLLHDLSGIGAVITDPALQLRWGVPWRPGTAHVHEAAEKAAQEVLFGEAA